MNKFLSIVVWAFGAILTIILFFVMAALFIVTFPFDKNRKLLHAQCFWWSDILSTFNPFWKVRISGLENIDKKAVYVIVANHQSLADIVVLYKTRMQFKWVAKESLFKVPFIGWCLALAGHIALKRGSYSSVKKIYQDAAVWLKRGVSVLLFPEGTRSQTDSMNPFQNGAFKLAIKEKRPILPVVVSGTRNIIPRGSWIFNSNTTCSIKVCPQRTRRRDPRLGLAGHGRRRPVSGSSLRQSQRRLPISALRLLPRGAAKDQIQLP